MIEKGMIVLSNKIMVSDPCYDLNTWCQIVLDNLLPGKYRCFYDMEENRIANIYIFHEKYKTKPTSLVKGEVGVDSGQAGFYDFEFFKENKEDESKEEKFYDDVCDLTYVNYRNPDYKRFEESDYFLKLNNEEYIRTLAKGKEIEAIIDKYIDYLKATEEINSNEKLKSFVDMLELDRLPNEMDTIKALLEMIATTEYYKDYKISHEYLSKFDANTYMDKSFVSSSGYGDGGYNCYIGYNSKKQIVSAKIRFL